VSMKIERASVEELDEVVALLSEASAWLRARGIEHWPDPYPADWVEPSIRRGETCLARRDGDVVGTITLRWDDPAFWGDQPPVAGYVHGIVVRREFAGLGPQLLDWADEQVHSAGRELLRLDCRTDNTKLRRYYEGHGFVHRGDTTVSDFRTSIYERPCRVERRDRARGAAVGKS
jgi:ribosomal protein S18 acetylase RimI-like enzyme